VAAAALAFFLPPPHIRVTAPVEIHEVIAEDGVAPEVSPGISGI
jgi:hypothetical protein